MISREKRLFAYMIPLLAVGFTFAIYLTVLHVRVFTQTDYQADSSVCSIGKAANCETVAENPWSVFLFMPVSVWGILGYLFTAVGVAAGFMAKDRRLPLMYLFAIGGLSCLVSLILGYISITKITSICIFCFGTYIVNFALMGLVVFGMVKDRIHPVKGTIDLLLWFFRHPLWTGLLGASGVGLLLAGFLLMPRYWVPEDAPEEEYNLPMGFTEDGHPWIGAEKPLVIIEEYSDFECPGCERAHRGVRQFVSRYPDAVRLVHRHFPLDQACNPAVTKPFHLAACERAKISICAGQQGKFWQANDILYANRASRFSSYRMSLALNLNDDVMQKCMNDPATPELLKKDINAGNQLKLNGTPAFFVEGVQIRSMGQLEKIIQDRLDLQTGVDDRGRHWIGAAEPEMIIFEFSDYQCPHCSREHQRMRELVTQFPKKLRLVHQHFPLDQACNRLVNKPFNDKACLFARVAHCAGKQNLFWQANDLLYDPKNHGLSLQEIAKTLDLKDDFLACVESDETAGYLRTEIEEGILRGLTGTPSFFIDGKLTPVKQIPELVRQRLGQPPASN